MPDSNQFFIWIDILGTASFAISGVLAARNRKLDLMGVLIIGFITAIGGGTLRDMLTGDLPVSWIRTIRPTAVILISSLIAIFFNLRRRFILLPLLVFDSLGLGLFTLLGIQKGMEHNLHPVICIMLGTVTACFGGVIRDIVLNTIPLIFRKEIYASACLAGGIVFFILQKTGLDLYWLNISCILLIFLVRIIAVKYNLRLPVINRSEEEPPSSGAY